MRTITVTTVCVLLLAAPWLVPDASAGRKAAEPARLTEAGQKLAQRYTTMRDDLRAELRKAVPFNAERKQAMALYLAEEAARPSDFPSVDARADLVDDDKPDELDDLLSELEQEQAKEEAIRNPPPKLDPKVEAALKFQRVLAAEAKPQPHSPRSAAYRQVLAERLAESTPLLEQLAPLLSSDKLDGKLAKFVVLQDATPHGLAAFAQQSSEHEQLVERLLGDPDLMVRMALADGARGGNYGRAIQLYTDIQSASARARDGVLERLALATALEHATPIIQRNPTAKSDAPRYIDPVNRYLHFEKAYLDGELDPGFPTLSVWDYRMVVNGYEPDWALAWGRQMLRNYRPDHITTPNYRWRYVASVRTDVRYGSQDNKYDRPELQFFQNILMNGGVCGRRAFFGRFILRAFGVPTIARPQEGHASLARWTPDGWAICLGGGWGGGWAGGPYNPDMNFLAITQARMADESYLQVKRAMWIGDVMGEKKVLGLINCAPEFWYGVAYYRQRAMIEKAKALTLAAVGEDIGEANESKVKQKVTEATVTADDRRITIGDDGVITIPAVATSKPTNSTRKIKFMPSNLGGMQLHYNRLGKNEEFEYTFESPKAGRYALTARIVTPSWRQHLFVTVNGAAEAIDIPLPHTVGFWDRTDPVAVTLVKGTNVLRFSREHARLKGVTIKDFSLSPLDGRDIAEAVTYDNALESLDPALVGLLEPPARKALEEKLTEASTGSEHVTACRELIRDFPQDYVIQRLCFERLVMLKGAEASGDLLAGLGNPNKWVRKFARDIAADLPGGGDTTKTWLGYLAAADDGVRPQVLQVLAARGDLQAAPPIRRLVTHEHEATKTAALSALVALADPDGVSAVIQATDDANPNIRKSAYLILASAPGGSATDALLTMARDAETVDKNALALQHGFLRLSMGNVADSDKIAVLRKLIELSRRPEEKRLALTEIPDLGAIEGLRLSQTLMTDPALMEEAAKAAVAIIESLPEEDIPQPVVAVGVEVMRDVVKRTGNYQTKGAANTFIYRFDPPDLDAGDPADGGGIDLEEF